MRVIFFLIQSILNVTVSSCVEHFTCVVKMLYNLQFTQALAALSTRFSPEERQAWSTSGALKKVKVKSHDGNNNNMLVFPSIKHRPYSFAFIPDLQWSEALML